MLARPPRTCLASSTQDHDAIGVEWYAGVDWPPQFPTVPPLFPRAHTDWSMLAPRVRTGVELGGGGPGVVRDMALGGLVDVGVEDHSLLGSYRSSHLKLTRDFILGFGPYPVLYFYPEKPREMQSSGMSMSPAVEKYWHILLATVQIFIPLQRWTSRYMKHCCGLHGQSVSTFVSTP